MAHFSLNSHTNEPLWPHPLDEQAYHGLAGTIVRTISPHSESDPAALLLQTLVAFGNVIGHGPHFVVESSAHHMNLFLALVGTTAKARKGTSWDYIFRLFREADPSWEQVVVSGTASGEGLVWHARDSGNGDKDKRVMLYEPEFASVLKVMSRDSNITSATLRQAWDSGNLSTLTKNTPAHATGVHMSLVGHITTEELRATLSATEKANGFGNRVIWLCVSRSKILPEGGSLSQEDFLELITMLSEIISRARTVERLQRNDSTRDLWAKVYRDLSEGRPGLVGAITSRAEAIVTRLSAVYALLDGTDVIQPDHLKAALAVWRYAEQSANCIFDKEQNLGAVKILRALEQSRNGLTTSEITTKVFSNHPADDLNLMLCELKKRGVIRNNREATGGRPLIRWYLSDVAKKAKKVS
jgi:hypothetical protein